VSDKNFQQNSLQLKVKYSKQLHFFMYVLLVTHRSEPYLYILWMVLLQRKLWILRNIPPLQPEAPAENS